ncbi:MAG TPA: AAA family ATPase [Roseiflexaceae bacterium]|nr:AAA family ATPase [Roseiflexaceae bacterium]HMP40309.1 AAA family ATPase [Roseiflexaceae bacterium]
MAMIDILIVSRVLGLVDALGQYEGFQVTSVPSVERAAELLAGGMKPRAVYIEDTCGSIDEIWRVVTVAQQQRIAVLIGLQLAESARRADFHDSGLEVTNLRGAGDLAYWIAYQLGARLRAGERQVMITVAGAKGGIGKSLVVALLAEGMRRRGLRVLLVDGDLSNSGVVPTFRIPAACPSYLQIVGDALARGDDQIWNAQTIRRYIYRHQPSGIDFLLGSEETTDARDLQRTEWQSFMRAVRSLNEYDVVLLDTGPEIKKRPYSILAARDGAWVVLPTPPGRKERIGVGNMLRVMQTAIAACDLSERCMLLYMEPEHGAAVTVDQIAPLFARHFPQVRTLGRLPRAPRQVSAADEEGDRYISPLDLAPHSSFSRAVHQIVDRLCREVDLAPPQPMPRFSLLQRLQGDRKILNISSAMPSLGHEV